MSALVSPLTSPRPRPDPARGVIGSEDLERYLLATADGDQEAFATLYTELLPLVRAVVTGVLRDQAQAEEVAQEVMLELWHHAGRYRSTLGGVRTWTATIARRRAVDRLRHHCAQTKRDQQWATHEHTRPQRHDNVSDHVERQLAHEAVRRALGSLTDLQGEAIHLAFYEDHPYAQVAERLGVPHGTAKARIRDALARLRQELTPQYRQQ
ncbi:sigma-70 family RNA polymerase sigma factor [Kitasatospora sp. NPDC002040]|uniref:sigma-70 family RNA polymerase sigma factor n=1 Tax=Kitasatospora sp. NPDC002040 TaxID=3154661 RepID=UPI00331C55F1